MPSTLTPEQSEIMIAIVSVTSGGTWTSANQDLLICMHSPLGEEAGYSIPDLFASARMPPTHHEGSGKQHTAPTGVAVSTAPLQYSSGETLSSFLAFPQPGQISYLAFDTHRKILMNNIIP